MDDYQKMTYHLPPTISGWLTVTEAFHPDWTVTIDGQPGVVEREERSAGGDITTYIKGSKSGTRAVKWGQDAPGQLTIRESRRIHD